ncbi:MAG: dihydroorotase [Chloroflexi bacterium]|jgi:dihydroorotase|nr:MAG: dihydroorotase [Chloroflexota bacterium]
MTKLGHFLIKNARLLDVITGMDEFGDILVDEGLIKHVGAPLRDGDIPERCRLLNGDGLVVCPGFIDLHTHLREPGYEDKETISTGVAAAVNGGFTTICAMPNTNPPMDNAVTIEYVIQKAALAGKARVLPIGCVTKGSEGKQLAELWEMAQSGAVGFSDDGKPVADSHLMRQALAYSSGLALPVIQHSEDLELSQGSPVNEGWISNRTGLRGWPSVAEESVIARDIALAELTGGRLHVAHITTSGSVDLIRLAKQRGANVTAEVTPHHLTLDERWVLGHDQDGPINGPLGLEAYDTFTKVNPPLRSREDVEALIAGLNEGVIDVIATDHAPQTVIDKLVTYDDAAYGFSGLETAFGLLMTLVHDDRIDLMTLVSKLTVGPLVVLGDAYSDLATLRKGTTADIVVFDPNKDWIVSSEEFNSKGKNTPIEGVRLKGKVVMAFVGGNLVYEQEKLDE